MKSGRGDDSILAYVITGVPCLTNTSTTSRVHLWGGGGTFTFYALSKFKLYNTVLFTGVTMLYRGFSDLIYFTVEVCTLLPAPGNRVSALFL